MIMPLFRDALVRGPKPLAGFFVPVAPREHRDRYERVYGQLQGLKTNLDGASWASVPG